MFAAPTKYKTLTPNTKSDMISRKITAYAIISLVFACVLFTRQLRLDRYMMMDFPVDPNKEEVEKCIFILSSPGSGSSTMVNLLQNCEPGCMISGENRGALQTLERFYQKVVRTDKQPRQNIHQEEAWKKYFNLQDVEESINNLVRTILNPDGSQCWGFKEIRYGRDKEESNLSNDVEFLSSFCQNPKIIFHTKRKPEDEFNSKVLRDKGSRAWNITRLQHQAFDSYVKKDKTSGNPNPKVFRHHLEDYLERNTHFEELWEYLECSSDVPEETIEIVSKKQNEVNNNDK